MAENNCLDILIKDAPQIHAYLREKTGIELNLETGEGKQQYIDAATELRNRSINELHNVYAGLGIKGFEKLAAKPVTPPTQQGEGVSNEGKVINPFIVKKFVAEGNNEVLNDEDSDLADSRIEKIVKSATSPENAMKRLRAAGYVLDFTDAPTFLAFVQDRIDGKTTKTFSEFRQGSKADEQKQTPSIPLQKGEGVSKAIPKSTRQSEARKVYKDIGEVDEPTDARGMALAYFAGGNKINEASINEVSGTVKGASLNTGAKEKKTSEVKARDYSSKDAPTIDEVAHSIWDNLPEDLQRNISTQDLKNELNDVVNSHNTRLSAAMEFRDRYIVYNAKGQLTEEEAKYNSERDIHQFNKIFGELPENQQNDIVGVLEKYKDSAGNIDWEAAEKDSNGFDVDMLSLPQETQKSLYGLIETNLKSGQGERSSTISEDRSRQKEESQKRLTTAQSEYDKAASDLKKAEDNISKKQSTQGSLLPSEGAQKEMFGVNRDEAKSILDPLRQKVKETKSELEKAQKEFDASKEAKTPELPLQTEAKVAEPEKAGQTGETAGESQKITGEQAAASDGTQKPPEPPQPPKSTAEETTKEFKNDPKSILNRLNESKNVGEETKKKFEQKGLRYNPQSHEAARSLAKEIIDEFGVEDSIAMAESERFDGDVNSMIFAEGIDRTFEAEQAATSQKDKIKFAEQWADYAIRFDESSRQKGRFISAIYDFYKKSPLGVILSERAKRDEAFKDWFTKREKPFKEVFDAIKEEPEFKELVKEKVESQLKSERAVYRMKRRNRITEIFDSAKIKGDQLSSSIIPPGIWNGAVEVMKQAALAGESIVSIIEKGVGYIKKNHGDAWDETTFTQEWKDKLSTIDGNAVKTDEETLKNKQQKILERFRKKLSGLNEQQKEDVIRKSFKKLVENGALEYEDFKKIVADVIGLGELTAEETQRLTGFIKDLNAVQDLSDNVLKKETKESLIEFEKGVKKAEQSATKLAGMLYNKPKIAQRIRSIIQLNTLGVVSLIKNPFYNIFHQLLVRLPKGVFMTALDQSIYGITLLGNKMGFGNPIIKPDVNILLAQKGYFSKGAEGGAQSVKQMFTGLTNKDYFQKEIYNSQIKPFQSWRDLWDWGKGNKNLTKGQIADKAIQGTVGIPAEMVARMLNIGDKPFRYAAEAAIAETIATQEFGLKGIEREIFLRLPKEKSKQLYLKKGLSAEQADKKSEAIEKRIISEGEEAVFQQSNVVSDVINGIKQQLATGEDSHPLSEFSSGATKLFGLLNMPFVKTPVNIAWEVFNLVNPEFALLQSFAYGVKAAKTGSREDFLKAKKWMAHAATGWALLALTGYLSAIGAASGDDEDEPYKAKEAKGKGTFEKPKRINLSKINRAALGGSLEDKDGDVLVDLSWFGAFGMIMNMQANKHENMTKAQRENMSYADDLLFRLRAGATEGLTNSVFQGTLTAVDALRTGKTDQWLTGMINVGSNFIEPATLAQISRATRPYDYQLKADNFSDKLKNNIRARFFGETTPKVNIWGDTIKREGTPGDVALRMLGIGVYDKQVFGEPIHQDFKRTGNANFYPPAPSNKFTEKGVEVILNAEQHIEFEKLVGQARKLLVEPFVNGYATINGSEYEALDDEQKLKELSKKYDQGRENGKKEFLLLHPELLYKN